MNKSEAGQGGKNFKTKKRYYKGTKEGTHRLWKTSNRLVVQYGWST